MSATPSDGRMEPPDGEAEVDGAAAAAAVPSHLGRKW